MYENNTISLEIESKEKPKEIITKKFTIELILYNNIYDKENKTDKEPEIKKDFIDKERIVLDIPINKKEDKNSSSEEYFIQILDLKQQLKKKGYPITTSKLYIYLNNASIDDYVFINDDKEIIYSSMLSKDNTIKLKLKNYLDNRLINNTFLHLKKHFSEISSHNSEKNVELPLSQSVNTKEESSQEKGIEFNKRTRKIGEIVKNVYAQRMLFNGFYNDEGNKVKFSLQEASDKVGIPKKTLDDYLKQIRIARENGFDFNKNKDKPISFLRQFNNKTGLNKPNKKQKNEETNIEFKSEELNLEEDV